MFLLQITFSEIPVLFFVKVTVFSLSQNNHLLSDLHMLNVDN